MMKRTLRNLRTWAPPISIGVIVGVLGYFAVEKLDAPAPIAASEIAAPLMPQPVVSANAQTQPFGNCREARAAGAAPVYAGQPGYSEHLDADRDGIGCEPYLH